MCRSQGIPMNMGFVDRACRIFQAFAFVLVLAVSTGNAMAAGYFVQSGKIYDANNQEIQIRGVSHYGFNSTLLRPQLLWAMGWKEQIAQIKSLGFNAIRLPIVPDTLYNTTPIVNGPGRSYIDENLNGDLIGKTPLQALDLWMAEANRQGIYILLDFHSVSMKSQYGTWFINDPEAYGVGKWAETYNGQPYTKENWIRDLAFVAQRYANLPRFFGIDLYNEPNGIVRWSTGDVNVNNPIYFWKPAAELASAAVLAANPNLLIFVQGINGNYDGRENSNIPMNWGEDFQPQAYQPLNIPNDKLVLTPHTYGPDVYVKSSFSAANFPANLAADWNTLFGQFYPTRAVVIGEWGGRYTPGSTDRVWQNAFVDYLIGKGIRNSFYWVYTPNSGDTGGILDDNLNVRLDKMDLVRRLWGTSDVGSLPIFGDAMAPLWELSGWSSTTAIQNQFVNSGVGTVKVDATTWGGVSFDSRDANWVWVDQPANRYTHLSFDVSAGAVMGATMGSLEASLDLGWGLAARISNYVTSFAPGAWYHVEIPLSIMNPNSVAFRKIVFQNNSTSNLTFYLDNVALINRNGPPIPPSGGAQLQSCAGILPLGDSITLGVNGGYRNDLYTGLQQNNCNVDYVGTLSDQYTHVVDKQHEGHSGLTIGDIASGVNAWITATQPNIILLMIGTNDTAWYTNEDGTEIGARHNALIDQLRAARPNAWIFVASIAPQSSLLIHGKGDADTARTVDRAILTQQLNSAIRTNVEARVTLGQSVRFVDVNSALTVADLYDGIHPTEAAHARVAQKFLEGIRAALGSPATPPSAYTQQGITNFSPSSGPAGTVVTVNGSGFTGSNIAWVGAAHNGAVRVISDTQLQVTVPAGATTGSIGIFNPTYAAFTATTFTVQ